MYDWEITKILASNNYDIDSEVYINICNSSPQLNHIKFNPYGSYMEMWSNENYWKFTVYRKEN